MFCGLCEEACPEEAIVMSRDVELSTFTREEMLFHKKDLLRTEERLARRLEYIRAGYDR
jgi:NADH-quinone oxidoreductase subunit I